MTCYVVTLACLFKEKPCGYIVFREDLNRTPPSQFRDPGTRLEKRSVEDKSTNMEKLPFSNVKHGGNWDFKLKLNK